MNRLRRAALVMPLFVGLASCAEDEPVPKMPDPTVEPTTAQTATETPEPKEPWEEKSYAGAEAFAEHWFDVFSEAMNDGDLRTLRSISDPDCTNCNGFIDRIEDVYTAGGSYDSKGWRVIQVTAAKSSPVSTPTLGLRVKGYRATYTESTDGPERRDPPFEYPYSAELRWAEGRWSMTKFEPVA